MAVIDQGTGFSYEQFNREIGKMLAALRDLNVLRGQHVGVEFLPELKNFPSFYYHWVKLLALEGLGVATMSFARAEAPYMKEILGALDLVLVFPDAPDIPARRQHVMDKDWITQAMARAPDLMPARVQRQPGDAARIIKSSGTTGVMKYMIRSVENQEYIYRTAQFCGGYTQQSRFFATGGFSVSAFHAAAVTCIRAGGMCVYETRQSAEKTLSLHAITHASFLVHSLMQILKAIPDDYRKPPDLKVLTIGSPVSEVIRARLLASLAAQVSETYGTNESSTISTIDATGEGAILPGVEVEVVDDDDQPVIGTLGRIRVRSQGCVQGYLNNSSANEKMFRDGWFYPGDIGVKKDAHTLRLIGRSDSLLNIRGLKYAPEAFEEEIMATLPVRDVCMLTLPDHENIEQVVIVVVLKPRVDQKNFISRLQSVVPAIFGETRVDFVSHIPRTGSGKIERQSLRSTLRANLKN